MTTVRKISSLKRISSTCDVKRLMNPQAERGQQYIPTDVEHLANIITHGMAVPPSALATLWMLYMAKTGHQYFIALLYGFALMTLFSVSCTYHVICYKGVLSELKKTFHFGDRAVIYMFIASSYTPWLMLKGFSGLGEEVLCTVWTMAVCGIIYQYFFLERYKCMEILFYVVIGVCPAAVIYIMEKPAGLYELTLGGITYISGIAFFKLDGIIPFAHAIWHCFVFVGSMYHYYAICTYLLGHEVDENVPEF